MADKTQLIDDSVLPMALQTDRFQVLESLLGRLNTLPKHTIIMLTDLTPASALPYFADMFSLFGDGWQFATTEDEQRQLIKQAIEIHRHKGTPWSIKGVLKLLGYGDCIIEERHGYNEHDGTINHAHQHRYGGAGIWTHYRVLTNYAISQMEVDKIKALLADVAPLRCKLIYVGLPVYHDSTYQYNATINHSGALT